MSILIEGVNEHYTYKTEKTLLIISLFYHNAVQYVRGIV